tara:strand:- start:5968 stop:6312 length:345 start_codon:yes stop_codon:yes gene_type:complete
VTDVKIQKLRASHILISHIGATAQTSNRPAPAAEQEAGFIIQDIIEGLLTFDQAAKEHSACRKSAKNGGDLGWFHYPGDMEYEIAKPISGINKDEMLTFPIKTEYGYHILLRTG